VIRLFNCNAESVSTLAATIPIVTSINRARSDMAYFSLSP
jgi:hypothetical protein